MVGVDTTTLEEKAQAMGKAVSGIHAILFKDGQLKIVDDAANSTMREIRDYFSTHGCDITRMPLKYVTCQANLVDKTVDGCINRGETLLYKRETLPQAP